MMPEPRRRQLAYSDLQHLMLDEESRRAKAGKITAVVEHFLGRADLNGLVVIDVGCSGGIVADELSRAGAKVVGLDIDRPGLAKARSSFADTSSFVCGDSEELPIRTGSVDVVICNHVYEHVVDPVRLFAELRRAVKPSGALYLGLGNRLGVMEPHYRLPFLSWLPRGLAHRYVRAFGRADHYHESFRTRRGLRELCAGFYLWDYTYPVLMEPQSFMATDAVPGWIAHLPRAVLRAARPLIPTYIWVATASRSAPRGQSLRVAPEHVARR